MAVTGNIHVSKVDLVNAISTYIDPANYPLDAEASVAQAIQDVVETLYAEIGNIDAGVPLTVATAAVVLGVSIVNNELSIDQASTTSAGLLSVSDFTTFNNKSDTDTVYDDTSIQAAVTLNTAKVSYPGDQTLPTDFDPAGTDNSDNNAPNSLYDSLVSNVAHPLVETAVPVGAVFTDTITETFNSPDGVYSGELTIAYDTIINVSPGTSQNNIKIGLCTGTLSLTMDVVEAGNVVVVSIEPNGFALTLSGTNYILDPNSPAADISVGNEVIMTVRRSRNIAKSIYFIHNIPTS